ncbi:STAS domain-containing protein [Bacillus sp. FJAT-45350]|uniref:STAS domain-containing protein n=1 Tax=Bacillus sp. FJAT-45350 TaxID=2011014 RepID=UPI000BB81BB8|nr:STAS domain-containing protein [Bacillus sp. FJAT-45350]
MIEFINKEDSKLAVIVQGDINFETARELEITIMEQDFEVKAKEIEIDLSDVRFIDSTGVSLLIKWLHPLSKESEIIISNASEPIKNILKICKIDQFVTVL